PLSIAPRKSIVTAPDAFIPATEFMIATEDYPLKRRLYFYVPVLANNPLAKDFVAFAESDKGQAIVHESKFVGLSISTQQWNPCQTKPCVPSYQDYIKDAKQLSVNFRFQFGKTKLDSRGQRDLERVLKFMKEPANQGRKLKLVGFADNTGGDAFANSLVSQQ